MGRPTEQQGGCCVSPQGKEELRDKDDEEAARSSPEDTADEYAQDGSRVFEGPPGEGETSDIFS